MSEKTENACSSAPTPEQAVEGTCNGSLPEKEYKTCSGAISSALSRGAENAKTLRDLEALTGLNGRTIRRQIEAERRQGIPILSDSRDGYSGYYLPENDFEIRRFVGSMRSRAREILTTAQAVENGERPVNA